MGLGGEGLEFRVSGSGFGFQSFRLRVPGSEFRVPAFGFRVPGSGFRVLGSGFWVGVGGVPTYLVWGLEFRFSGFRVWGLEVGGLGSTDGLGLFPGFGVRVPDSGLRVGNWGRGLRVDDVITEG